MLPITTAYILFHFYHVANNISSVETKFLQELLSRQINAEEHRDKVLKDLNRRIFAQFSEKYDMWNTAVYKLSVIDVLISLSEYALSGDMCVPEINDGSDGKVILTPARFESFIKSITNITNFFSTGIY